VALAKFQMLHFTVGDTVSV